MAKTTTRKTTKSNNVDQGVIPSEVLPEICKMKHDVIDKEFNNIKNDADRKHEEIKEMILSFRDSIKEDVSKSHSNLKDKIVLTEKTIGDKIDSLSEFDDTLKGNGSPGVWESIRSLNKSVKIIVSILIIIVTFELGGSWSRINWDTLREKLWGTPETNQVEPVEKKEGEMYPVVIEKEKTPPIVIEKTLAPDDKEKKSN